MPTQTNSGIEIIHHLRHQAGPVDRIDGGQAEAPREIAVVEHPLHESLSIIEAAVDSNIMDVVSAHGGHLAPLHVRYASIRMKHEDLNILQIGRTLSRERVWQYVKD